jgi:hypothetical protein
VSRRPRSRDPVPRREGPWPDAFRTGLTRSIGASPHPCACTARPVGDAVASTPVCSKPTKVPGSLRQWVKTCRICGTGPTTSDDARSPTSASVSTAPGAATFALVLEHRSRHRTPIGVSCLATGDEACAGSFPCSLAGDDIEEMPHLSPRTEHVHRRVSPVPRDLVACSLGV